MRLRGGEWDVSGVGFRIMLVDDNVVDEFLLACRCCTGCGRVLADDAYSTEVTFTKGADGSVWHFLRI